ncbi:site-specific integrase [Mycobacteroides franklinii]|uniref:Site-specific integrase n=2 Tax=Mycobacteroides franklinii TaxID=948102 RepID=A0A4R5PFY1_9MYCO|nr:recombinase XerD [Mycobacteroides franklinii]TDH25293.1 site-specific integrase [Mycobacteroides franklinii]
MSSDTSDSEPPKKRGEPTDSSITKLPNGRGWRARPPLGADPVTGKQVRPTKVFATKRAAQDWVTEQRQQWSTATWAPKSSRTFDEVADHWLMLREADKSIGPNTVRADRESLPYARRAFGAVPVQHLTPPALANWSATLTGKEGRALAPATRRRAIVRLKSVLVHARKMRWLTYDPSADLESPEQKSITATAADDIWTPEQMNYFLNHIAAHRLCGCFALTLLGLRREEVGGLRWSDIDINAGALQIRQARVDVNGRDTIVTPKTDRSARDLPVPARELAMLKAITLGKLRHSSISRMRAADMPPTWLPAWHGHAERTTQAVYGRVTDDRLIAASAVISANAVGGN